MGGVASAKTSIVAPTVLRARVAVSSHGLSQRLQRLTSTCVRLELILVDFEPEWPVIDRDAMDCVVSEILYYLTLCNSLLISAISHHSRFSGSAAS